MPKRKGQDGGIARAELGYIPPGLTYKEWRLAQKKAEEEAFVITNRLKEKGLINTDDVYAEEALEAAISVVRNPKVSTKDRLYAAKIVLDFTKQKPSQKVDVGLKAEDFLDKLAAEEDG